MSDASSRRDMEDVLASIRRLVDSGVPLPDSVAPDARDTGQGTTAVSSGPVPAARGAGAAGPGASAGQGSDGGSHRLVLTEAQRVGRPPGSAPPPPAADAAADASPPPAAVSDSAAGDTPPYDQPAQDVAPSGTTGAAVPGLDPQAPPRLRWTGQGEAAIRAAAVEQRPGPPLPPLALRPAGDPVSVTAGSDFASRRAAPPPSDPVRAAPAAGGPAMVATSAPPAATEAGSDGTDDAEAPSLPRDEAALRTLIAEVVREELQGVFGERISRNLRRMVRAEIANALAARSLD